MKRDYTDAEFEVIGEPKPAPKDHWNLTREEWDSWPLRSRVVYAVLSALVVVGMFLASKWLYVVVYQSLFG